MSEILFQEWCNEPPSVAVMVSCAVIVAALLSGLLLRKLYLQAVFVGAIAAYMAYCFIDASIRRECVTIYTDAIRVRNGAFQFNIKAIDVKKIEAMVYPKDGARAVFVYVKNEKKGVEIPMVTGERHMDYYFSLVKFCEMHHIPLMWSEEVSKPYSHLRVSPK